MRLALHIGRQRYAVLCLDSGTLLGDLGPPPREPRRVAGLSAEAQSAFENLTEDVIAIVFIHAPPVSLAPNDPRHTAEDARFIEDEASYGVFEDRRAAFIHFLRRRALNGLRTLVVSGHVHYRAAYAVASNGPFIVGNALTIALEQLANGALAPATFWKLYPVVLLTTPAIGPRPRTGDGGVDLLRLILKVEGIVVDWRRLD
jgi:hypothetical protein